MVIFALIRSIQDTFNSNQISRASVSPPQLTGDTPILDILQPIVPGLFVMLRNQLEITISDGGNSSSSQIVAFHPPLRFDHGFNDILTSGAKTNSHGVGFITSQESQGFQICSQSLSGFESGQVLELPTQLVDETIFSENVDFLQIVLDSGLEIVGVMSGGDLDSSGTEFGVDQFVIGDNNHLSVGSIRMDKLLTDQMSVSLILRMDGDGDITQHGFQTGSGNNDFFVTVLNLVGKLG
mmetsp:Transcript_15190/g.16897  ORF Transcript_15190/g.16897 Transcript_15190/m.16897 type:complete len:238 (-) Transcript_15190:959-1672(-)